VVSLPQVSRLKPSMHLSSPLPHTCHMFCPSKSSLLDHQNYIWWGVKSIKLLVMQSSPLPCYLISSSAPYSRKPSAYISPWIWATKFHSHIHVHVFTSTLKQTAEIYTLLCKYHAIKCHDGFVLFSFPTISDLGRVSIEGIETCYGLDGPGIESR
jgi:hypothetical protein